MNPIFYHYNGHIVNDLGTFIAYPYKFTGDESIAFFSSIEEALTFLETL